MENKYSKGRLKKIVMFFTALFFFVVMFGGASSPSSGKPKYISNFEIWMSGAEYQVKFSLQDENMEYIAYSGLATLFIYNSKNEILYQGNFSIDRSDYEDYIIIMSTKETSGTTIKYGIFSLPQDSVKKCIGLGKAKLTFTYNDKDLTIELENVYVQEYTEEEIMKIHEDEYNNNCIIINKSIEKYPFIITLLKLGPYTKYQWLSEEDCYRIDIKIQNIGTEKEYLWSDIVILDDKNNQYDMIYGGNFDFGDIYPNVIKSGYVLFPEINPLATSLKIIITKLEYPEDILYEFNIEM